ncbi:MAG: VWA domain-containing protein [Chloroflexota bacterium]
MITSYSRWDGSQQPPALDADEVLEAMSDDLLEDGDVWRALQRMFRRGAETPDGEKMPGLRDMLEQLRRQREQQLDRYNLSTVLDDIKKRLEEIQRTERVGIDRRVQDGREKLESGEAPEQAAFQKALERMADQKRDQLSKLPKDPAGQIKALGDYDFMSPDARQQYQDLLDMLKQQMMEQTFKGMQQAIQGMSPEGMQTAKSMLQDLNEMLRREAEGSDPGFEQFMQQWGEFFPGANSMEQLIEQLRQSISQMQSLMDSMSPDQRRQLRDMMEAAMQDPDLQNELAELAMNLDQLQPLRDSRRRYPFHGDEPLSLQEAMKLMEQLQGMDRLEQQIRRAEDHADLDEIDANALRELMGDPAADNLDQLKQLRKLLEDAGYLEKQGDTYELTPRALRKIGQKALTDIFAQLKRDRFGRHETELRGAGGERTDDSKRYEFGDPFLLDLRKTVMNAVERGGAGSPLTLSPDDFEVYRTELSTQASTVLMIDMSRSMMLRGCFRAAKKVALALNSLIKGQFPRDSLHIIAFSYVAKEIKPESLPGLTWNEWVYGTNLQHAFMLARQLLARQRGGNKQIIVITDGEPTAHFENGRVEFNYPPTWRTFQETFREVQRCTREGATINTFMLERSTALQSFVEQVTKINRGRAFYAEPEHLGEYILVDYVNQKRRSRRAAS